MTVTVPAHRKPTTTLKLAGAFAKDPARGRARRREPAPNGPIGAPPRHLKKLEREAWLRIVAEAPTGVLTKADRIIVELTASLLALKRTKPLSGFLAQQLRACCAALGMTPADRSRVGASGETPRKSPWDEIDGAPN